MDKPTLPGTPRWRPEPLDYSCSLGSYRRIEVGEGQALLRDTCPYCATRIDSHYEDHDVVGGKHFAYVAQPCEACGWWSILKCWENERNTILAAAYWSALLKQFSLSQKDLDVCDVLEALMRNPKRISDLHWKTFERVAGAYLRDQGYKVHDIARIPCSGGDFIAINHEGNRVLVDAKHWRKPVGLDVVRVLVGAMWEQGHALGMLVTSGRFTGPAKASLAVQRRLVSLADFEILSEWFSLRRAQRVTTLSLCQGLVLSDAMSEM